MVSITFFRVFENLREIFVLFDALAALEQINNFFVYIYMLLRLVKSVRMDATSMCCVFTHTFHSIFAIDIILAATSMYYTN